MRADEQGAGRARVGVERGDDARERVGDAVVQVGDGLAVGRGHEDGRVAAVELRGEVRFEDGEGRGRGVVEAGKAVEFAEVSRARAG